MLGPCISLRCQELHFRLFLLCVIRYLWRMSVYKPSSKQQTKWAESAMIFISFWASMCGIQFCQQRAAKLHLVLAEAYRSQSPQQIGVNAWHLFVMLLNKLRCFHQVHYKVDAQTGTTIAACFANTNCGASALEARSVHLQRCATAGLARFWARTFRASPR